MGSLFKSPKMPKAPKPVPMPDEEELTKARRRNLAKTLNRPGSRQSTILTDMLGGY